MRALISIVPVAVLAGCATPISPMTEHEMLQKLSAASNYEVCAATTVTSSRRYPGLGGLADAEAVARGLDCLPYMPAIMADKQARAQARMTEAQAQAARAAAWQATQSSIREMYRPSPTLNCTSQAWGGGMGTINCH